MIIDFNNITAEVISQFKGGNGDFNAKIFFDGQNKILHGRLEPGSSIGLHTHETNSEIIYILSGSGTVLYDGEVEPVKHGECHYCSKGHSHSLINSGNEDLIFFAVVPEQ